MEDVLSKVREIWGDSNSVAALAEQQWHDNKMLCQSRHLTARRVGQSNLFVPMIERFHYRKQADHFFAFTGENPVSLKKTLTSTANGAAIMERVVNFYLKEAGGIDWDSSILNGAHNALTYNFAPWFVDWDRGVDFEDVEIEVVKDGAVVTETTQVEKELYSYPTFEVLSPDDIRIDPAVGWNEIGLARYGIVRRWRDKAFAQKMHRSGEWPEIPDSYFSSYEVSQLKNTASDYGNQVSDGDFVEVWHSFYYNEDGEPVTAVTAEDMLVLEDETELEFDLSNADGSDPWPFGVGYIYAEPHQLYSRAMPEKLHDLQVEKNAIRNQRRDNVSLTLNREKFMTPSAGIDPATLSRSIAGKVNVVASRDSVWWDTPPDVTGSSYQEESVATSDAEQLVSESAQRMGGSGQRKETATVAKITAANSAAVTSLDTSVFGMSFCNRSVEKIITMIRQAAPAELFVAAAEDASIESADPYFEALTGKFSVKVGNGVQQAARDMAISQASNTAAIIQSVYGPQANYYDILAPMLEQLGYSPNSILQSPQGQQNQLVEQDLGGVQEQIPPQQVAAVQGGQFGSVPTEDGSR